MRVHAIRVRPSVVRAELMLREHGMHPLLARLYASRGIVDSSEAGGGLDQLLRPDLLLNSDKAAALLADSIEAGERLLIVADYDCDGATACAVGLRALRAMGAHVDYIVPDRFKLGYGLSAELVEQCLPLRPDLIITVDNGIASIAGVAYANRHGIRTLITDHHLSADQLPLATCIVNPNQPDCRFPSKSLAGVGVMCYVMLALRAEWRRRAAGVPAPAAARANNSAPAAAATSTDPGVSALAHARGEVRLADLLPLVALGTVADVVPLDRNNRILVSQGLSRIRAGKLPGGMRALFAAAGRDPRRATSDDLSFGLAPRINAAGRITDMSIGIEALTADDETAALELARRLDTLNAERRVIQADMAQLAETMVPRELDAATTTLTLYDPDWHQGVIGIIAGRIKDQRHRPTFVFAPAEGGTLRGSGRAIAGFHLRDCLDLVSKAAPDLLLRFGGHAAAAGATIPADRIDEFRTLFEQVARRIIDPQTLEREILTDGPLDTAQLSLDCARLLEAQIWGQGFAPPLFSDHCQVVSQKLVGGKHTKARMRVAGATLEAIQFNSVEPLPAVIHAAFRLAVSEYNGLAQVQLVIEHWEAPS